MKTYEQGDLVWGSWLLVGAVYETWALYRKYQHRTASQTTRRWWRVDTLEGKIAFTVTVVWYLGHVFRWWR